MDWIGLDWIGLDWLDCLDWSIDWFIVWFIDSLLRSFIDSLIHGFIGSLILPFIGSLTHFTQLLHGIFHVLSFASQQPFTHSLVHLATSALRCFCISKNFPIGHPSSYSSFLFETSAPGSAGHYWYKKNMRKCLRWIDTKRDKTSCTMVFSSISMNQLQPPRWSFDIWGCWESRCPSTPTSHSHSRGYHCYWHRMFRDKIQQAWRCMRHRWTKTKYLLNPFEGLQSGLTIYYKWSRTLWSLLSGYFMIQSSFSWGLLAWEGRAPASGRFVPNSLQRIPREGGRTADPPGFPRCWFRGDGLGWRPAPRMQ